MHPRYYYYFVRTYGARGRMRGQLLKEQTSTGPRRFGPSIHGSCSWILFLDPTAWSSRHRQQPKAKSKRPPWARLRLARVKCVMWTRGRQLISHRTAEATQPHQKSQLYSVLVLYGVRSITSMMRFALLAWHRPKVLEPPRRSN